jgi:hypothetical protein
LEGGTSRFVERAGLVDEYRNHHLVARPVVQVGPFEALKFVLPSLVDLGKGNSTECLDTRVVSMRS